MAAVAFDLFTRKKDGNVDKCVAFLTLAIEHYKSQELLEELEHQLSIMLGSAKEIPTVKAHVVESFSDICTDLDLDKVVVIRNSYYVRGTMFVRPSENF